MTKAEKNKLYYRANRERIAIRAREYRTKNREHLVQYDRAYYEVNRDRILLRNRENRVARPELTRRANRRYGCEHRLEKCVYMRVKRAIESGKLKKPMACQGCGHVRKLLVAHHEDYGKPLSVRWFCRTCHGLRHRKPRIQFVSRKQRAA